MGALASILGKICHDLLSNRSSHCPVTFEQKGRFPCWYLYAEVSRGHNSTVAGFAENQVKSNGLGIMEGKGGSNV